MQKQDKKQSVEDLRKTIGETQSLLSSLQNTENESDQAFFRQFKADLSKLDGTLRIFSLHLPKERDKE